MIAAAGVAHTFQNAVWSATLPTIAVFDDAFVAENVCSGIEIGADQRQNLHELILGAQGVALNAALQRHVAANEEHNRQIRLRENAIPANIRGGLTVDAFCALPAHPDVVAAIQEVGRNLDAARSAEAIQREPVFADIALPEFDVVALNALMSRSLPDLEAAAVSHVQSHVVALGAQGERWLAEGVEYAGPDRAGVTCPFCEQDIRGSAIVEHYRRYFSEAYAALKGAIAEELDGTEGAHGRDLPAAFERNVRIAVQRHEFWSRFVELPAFAADTAGIALGWKTARDEVLAALASKQRSPLDATALSANAVAAIDRYHQARHEFVAAVGKLVALNGQIAVVKERAAAANVEAITRDLARLRLTETRHGAAVAPACDAYVAEKVAKAATEAARDQAREALDNYRRNVFPAYEAAINDYLLRFGAGFRISGVAPVNIRAGSTATYSVVINNVAVNLEAQNGPSFRNTLSAGDRNTLALAFFFAMLDRDPGLAGKIVTIDDPMTSLDEHRSLTTVQEIRSLYDRVEQVIVLSHSKAFLWALWEGAPRNARTAMRLGRAGNGSILDAWNITQDMVTEHDRRHARAVAYLDRADPGQERIVAADLRPTLEAFVRVAYPESFPAGSLLGPFIVVCQQRVGAANGLLSARDIVELRAILDYANQFHHDTNPAWQVAVINDHELTGFVRRVLAFTKRS